MKLLSALLLSMAVSLSACDRSKPSDSQNLLLIFSDKEQDVEAYQTRVLITPEFMRFDDGEGSVNYVLFDRKQQTIYSVLQESKLVTVINAKPQDVKPPFDLKLGHKTVDDLKDAPAMEGIRPQHHIYLVGEEVCYEAIVVPGFLSAYVEAMQAFNTVLANDAASTLASIPAEMHNACELAKAIFAPNDYLQAGFPLQKWGPDGHHSALLDFKRDYQADKTLFTIPESYKRLHIDEIRQGLAGQ